MRLLLAFQQISSFGASRDFQPEDSIAFRSHDAKALRKVCAFLRWKIVSDTSLTAGDLA